MYLLDGTTYSGATQVVDNADGGEAVDTPLTMNVSADSTWVVTGDSVVTDLNVEAGGSIVDEKGKTVSIVANGQTVVEGESKVTVTVNGSYGDSFETGDANAVSGATICRDSFDSEYGTTTAFEYDADAAAAAASADSSEAGSSDGGLGATIASWWEGFLRSLGL